VDWTVESQYLERTRNREVQNGPAVERCAGGSNPPANLGDAMIPPAELASTLQVRET
jgi:hypothetical protein